MEQMLTEVVDRGRKLYSVDGSGGPCYSLSSWKRVLIENRLDIKRESDQRKQQVNGVKRVQKISQESYKGCQYRQNTARGTRKRTIKGIGKAMACHLFFHIFIPGLGRQGTS